MRTFKYVGGRIKNTHIFTEKSKGYRNYIGIYEI